VLQISPLELRPLAAEFAVSAALGLVLGWTLWRFDLITTFVTLFVFTLVWSHVEGLLLLTSPEGLNVILSISITALVGVLGFVGAMSGKTSTEVPVIVPEYIEELAQRERLNREFELAREVQLSFLPVRTPDIKGLDIASICLPATEVGGDYYDFFHMPGRRLGVVVGDVSGKGMRAAFYMTLMKGILQSVVQRDTSPTEILSRANEIFRMNAPRGTFMSMIFGVLDPAAKTCIFARAGHNPVLVKRSSVSAPEVVKPNGAALGLAPDDVFVRNIEDVSIALADGDVLVIYTDGVTEAMNPARELYDDERLLNLVSRCGTLSAGLILDSIVQNVEEFQGAAPRHDDMTIVIIRIDGL
jgi:serine phosphatase RsbU (regulator of sigma subunit)